MFWILYVPGFSLPSLNTEEASLVEEGMVGRAGVTLTTWGTRSSHFEKESESVLARRQRSRAHAGTTMFNSSDIEVATAYLEIS